MKFNYQEKTLQFIACFIIELILIMPFYISDVYAQNHNESESPDTTPPFINMTTPDNYNKLRINLEGNTEPFSGVKLYVNGIYERYLSSDGIGESGKFIFKDVKLQNLKSNTIRIVAEDLAGNLNEITNPMFVDSSLPVVDMVEIPQFSKDQSIRINGTVDEQVVIDFYVISEKDMEKKTPSTIKSLHVDELSLLPNSITIAWVDNPVEEEVEEYLIYRDDIGLIATIANTPFTDVLVDSDKSYTYKISAVNKQCIESSKAVITIRTPDGGGVFDIQPQKQEHICKGMVPQLSIEQGAGIFDEQVNLFDGLNRIIINFTDITGNVFSISNTTYVDTAPPEILEVNFEELSPTYIKAVTLTGTISENATVHVYLNNGTDPETSVRTADDGSFSADLDLQRTISFETYEETGAQEAEIETGRAWINYVNVTAVDDSGQSSSLEGEITLAQCGQGADWDIDIGSITPDVILPRMLIEGIAQVGIDAILKWQGPGDERAASISNLELEKMPLNVEEQEKFDLDWIRSLPSAAHDPDYKNAYFLVNLKSPEAFGNTTLEKENNLTDYRVGECGLPEFGCIKLPMILRIDYSYEDPYNKSMVEATQKQCIDLKVMIDRRIPPDKVPEEFLRSSIQFLNSTIHLIDSILKPVKTARKWVFVACLVSWVVWWMRRAGEWGSCIGATPETCDPEGGDNADQCKECLTAKSGTISFWIKSQWLCDRIMCPAAPTIQKYVRDWQKIEPLGDDPGLQRSHCTEQPVSKIKYSAIKKQNELEMTFDEFMDPENMLLYLRPKAKNLAGYPDEEFCEYEYHMNYDSVSMFMNELEESFCVSNPTQDQMSEEGIDCGGAGKILRLFGGICTNEGAGNLTISVQHGQQTYYYSIYEESPDRLTAYRVLREKISERVVENGKTITREIERFTQKYPMFDSNKCKDGEGKPIKYDSAKYGSLNIITNKQLEDGSYSESQARSDYVPEEVFNAVCQPAKEYVVDPTSDLVTAFRSVCLTAISSYLEHWRTILGMVRNCFQTILYTGDGSAGICKQVLTVYLCDLIYFAIKCIKEKASTPMSDERPVGEGLGGFLSYMQDSSAKTQQGIGSRYGSSSVYKTLFVERKLIHAVCAFAFTGDWNLDLDSFLEEEIDIPIETSCFVTGTRRFLTKDPSQGGKAQFLYHIGGFIVSGADDLRYDVELICSNDNQCNADIDPSGACDCMKAGKGEQVRRVNIGPGHIEQGEVVDEEEFMQLVEGFRYDKVRILVSYTDAHGNSIENKVCGETRLVEVGHPPPADCAFDIADLSYHCQFEWGEHGSAEFRSVEFKNGINEFYDGSTLYIDGEIEKLERSSTLPNEKIALRYKIYKENSPLSVYKDAYIFFLESRPAIMDLFPSPLKISSKAKNDVSSGRTFEINPFVDINQQTAIDIRGVETPITLTYDREIILDDVIRTSPIKIKITENGNLLSEGCDLRGKTNIASGNVVCYVDSRVDPSNPYEFRIGLESGKTTTDITREITILIYPPRTQRVSAPGNQANMVLELSLHYLEEDGIPNPSPITVDGRRQVQTLSFVAYNRQQPVVGRTERCTFVGGRSLNTEDCYCNPSAESFDCGENKYCYQNIGNRWICTEYPKCGELGIINKDKCDCDLDGSYNAETDCDGSSKFYCYDGKCNAEDKNFPPDLQEGMSFYLDEQMVDQYAGTFPVGQDIFIVLTFNDPNGVQNVVWSEGEEFKRIEAGEPSRWIGKISSGSSGTLEVVAVDTRGAKSESEISV